MSTFRAVDGQIETRTKLSSLPEDDVSCDGCRSPITARTHTVALTSYAEIRLAPQEADLRIPAFSNLLSKTMAFPSHRDRLRAAAAAEPIAASGSRPQRTQQWSRSDRVRDGSRAFHRPRWWNDRPAALTRRLSIRPERCSIRSSASGRRSAFRLEARRELVLRRVRRERRGGATAGSRVSRPPSRGAALALASTHSDIELRHLGLTVEETMIFHFAVGTSDVRRSTAAPAGAVDETSAARPICGNTEFQATCRSCSCTSRRPARRTAARSAQSARVSSPQGFVFDLVVLNDHATSLPPGPAEHAAADGGRQP